MSPISPRSRWRVLREEARTAAAPMLYAGEDWTAAWDGDAFVYASREAEGARAVAWPARAAPVAECGAACAAVEALGDERITPEAMAAGLRETIWPGRLQQLKPGPLAGDGQVWVDAAHNPGGVATLASAIRARRAARTGSRWCWRSRP